DNVGWPTPHSSDSLLALIAPGPVSFRIISTLNSSLYFCTAMPLSRPESSRSDQAATSLTQGEFIIRCLFLKVREEGGNLFRFVASVHVDEISAGSFAKRPGEKGELLRYSLWVRVEFNRANL